MFADAASYDNMNVDDDAYKAIKQLMIDRIDQDSLARECNAFYPFENMEVRASHVACFAQT